MKKNIFKKLLPVIILLIIIFVLIIILINVKKSKNKNDSANSTNDPEQNVTNSTSFEENLAKQEKEFSIYKVVTNADGSQVMEKEKVKMYGTIENLFNEWKKINGISENPAQILTKKLDEENKTFYIDFDSELMIEQYDMPGDLHYQSLIDTINSFFIENGLNLVSSDVSINSCLISTNS